MKSIREQLTGKCKYFNGAHPIESKECAKGHKYAGIAKYHELGMEGSMLRLPCTGHPVGKLTRGHAVLPCPDYTPLTAEEIQAEIDEHERFMSNFAKGLSNCCEAPIDSSGVILEGEFKGHGPRFCSKCGKIVFIV